MEPNVKSTVMSDRVWLVKMISDDTVCSIHATQRGAEEAREKMLDPSAAYYVQCWTVSA